METIQQQMVEEKKNVSIVLKYFPIMGAAERVRLALWLGGIAFDDVRVPHADWAELKGQTPFGQIPVMSNDGGLTLPRATPCSNTLEHLRRSYALRISF